MKRINKMSEIKNVKSDSLMLLKKYSVAGFLISLIPYLIYFLWLYAFETGENHTERVALFQGFFPKILQGRFIPTYLSIVLLFTAIFFNAKAINISGAFWKLFNIIVLVLCGLLLALNLFSLL